MRDPSVRAAAAAIEAAGGVVDYAVANGGLDANWLTAHGIPTVSLGCGQNSIHTADVTAVTLYQLNQDDHLPYLSDFLAYLFLEQLPLAVHHLLHVGDALVHHREAVTTLALHVTDVLARALLLRLEQLLELRL